jgi:hypothetical protein
VVRDLLVQQAYAVAADPMVMAALIAGGLVAGVCAVVVARRRRWRMLPAILASLGLTLIVAMTMVRPPLPRYQALGAEAGSAPFCVVHGFAPYADSNAILNLWLFVPFALFATLATDRALIVLASAVALTGAIEVVQPITGVGVCETQDFGNNALGALVGVGLGWVLSAMARRR